MFGRRIANMIMLPKKLSFEEMEAVDSYCGMGRAFCEYHALWNRKAFKVKSDDITISGEYFVNPLDNGERKKVVIICHGQTGTRAGAIKYAKVFYDYGYSVVIFDERFFGETDGECCTLGYKEAEDIKKIITKTKEIFGENCFLGIHGESMGAAAALRLLDTEKPDFVIADCPFADLGVLIDELAQKRLKFFAKGAVKEAVQIGIKKFNFDFRDSRPIRSVEKSDVPICFMHGSSDKLIDCKHSQMMFAVCKNPLSEIHIFDDSDHAQSMINHPIEYRNTMLEFVNRIEETVGI